MERSNTHYAPPFRASQLVGHDTLPPFPPVQACDCGEEIALSLSWRTTSATRCRLFNGAQCVLRAIFRLIHLQLVGVASGEEF